LGKQGSCFQRGPVPGDGPRRRPDLNEAPARQGGLLRPRRCRIQVCVSGGTALSLRAACLESPFKLAWLTARGVTFAAGKAAGLPGAGPGASWDTPRCAPNSPDPAHHDSRFGRELETGPGTRRESAFRDSDSRESGVTEALPVGHWQQGQGIPISRFRRAARSRVTLAEAPARWQSARNARRAHRG
jgi:hypothetical protein